jgi:hypothetical protein
MPTPNGTRATFGRLPWSAGRLAARAELPDTPARGSVADAEALG